MNRARNNQIFYAVALASVMYVLVTELPRLL